jgi:uncharacterized protein
MKLDLRNMLAGECRSFDVDFQLTPFDYSEDRTSNLWGVHFSTPLKVVGRITNSAGYMRLSVEASIDYIAPCSRCLSDVSGSFSFTLEKTVAPKNILESEDEDKLDDYVVIEDGFLDIDDMLLELLELDFPYKLLCKDDCLGLCSHCGKDLNEGPCNCSQKEIDPRLAPLQKLLLEMQEKEKEDKNNK